MSPAGRWSGLGLTLRIFVFERVRQVEMPALADLLERQARARGAQAGVSAVKAYRIAPVMKRIRAW